MYLVDYLHQHGLGVILDWVPSHFPTDEHGLIYFVGEHVYEHQSPQQGYHPDWNTAIFNYGRHEVRAFLISSAMFWLDKFHVDGLRVDAVASMLYLDYSRKEGEWIPNRYGGRENLEAITFLRKFNEEVHRVHPDVLTMAEESTAWPMVSRPTYLGGLGFDLKWDMGWNHDTLEYFKRDPIHRRYHHDQLTFRAIYAFTENYVLCLSHDEVVYGKRALVDKMPGDEWQRFANARLLLGYMYMLPGKKLLFMGSEFGQIAEWNHERSLDWHVLQYPVHAGLKRWVQDLNRVYREQPGLHEEDCASEGFYWINASDCDNSVLTFVRRGRKLGSEVVVACNFTPVPRHGYVVGVPHLGYWKEILNSDAELYAGSGQGNLGGVEASPYGWNGQPARIEITLPPLGIVVLTSA
jgi:1,4-alpha-glucan branching enzyme